MWWCCLDETQKLKCTMRVGFWEELQCGNACWYEGRRYCVNIWELKDSIPYWNNLITQLQAKSSVKLSNQNIINISPCLLRWRKEVGHESLTWRSWWATWYIQASHELTPILFMAFGALRRREWSVKFGSWELGRPLWIPPIFLLKSSFKVWCSTNDQYLIVLFDIGFQNMFHCIPNYEEMIYFGFLKYIREVWCLCWIWRLRSTV